LTLHRGVQHCKFTLPFLQDEAQSNHPRPELLHTLHVARYTSHIIRYSLHVTTRYTVYHVPRNT